jgi:creatinine amidohydrolase
MRLQDMKWPQVKEYLQHNDVALLPVGATEQHGTHLPIGTDTFESLGWAEAAAEQTNTIVTPALPFGWSPHHMINPGTMTLAASTVITVVYELSLSLVFHGFRKVIIVNGHRETNLSPLKIAATRIANETQAMCLVVDPGYMGGAVGREMRANALGGVGHADELETSLIMHLRGEDQVDKVEMQRAVNRPQGMDPNSTADQPYRPLVLDELRALTAPTGALGNPSQASAAKGKRYNDALVASLVTLINSIRDQKITTRPVQLLV